MNVPSHFETERLLLAPLALTDSAFIHALLNSPGWIEFIGERNIHTLADAEAYIRKINETDTVTYWVVRPKTTQEAIGLVTLIQREYLGHPDIGFAFLPGSEGKGYAYEAASAVLKTLLQHADFPEILATTIPTNVRSIRLLEKLGLKHLREIESEGEMLLVYGIKNHLPEINLLITSFYGLFTNTSGQIPDLDKIHSLCLPETIIIKKEGLQQTVYTPETFITPRKKILTDGTLTGFEEHEVSNETTVSGNIAQRFSTYEKSGTMNGTPFHGRGTKLFQLVHGAAGWRISAVVWEDAVQ